MLITVVGYIGYQFQHNNIITLYVILQKAVQHYIQSNWMMCNVTVHFDQQRADILWLSERR